MKIKISLEFSWNSLVYNILLKINNLKIDQNTIHPIFEL